MFRRLSMCCWIGLVFSLPVQACLWDYDTLFQEKELSPTTLELIAGKFLRHSEPFYQWRKRDRTAKLKESPDSFELVDDLAVAHDKLGEHANAIELMLKSLAKKPDRYETNANLGTFYVHAGQFEEGVKYIERALEINPNAHFGREISQLWLIRYLMQIKSEQEEIGLPLQPEGYYGGEYELSPFPRFVRDSEESDDWNKEEELQELRQGIEGMMRFGKHDSPILLEALGDVLLSQGHLNLATRAFLKASYEVESFEAKELYQEKAKKAIYSARSRERNEDVTLEEIETDLRNEIEDARSWFEKVTENEKKWTAPDSGFNPDEEFSNLYHQQPILLTEKIVIERTMAAKNEAQSASRAFLAMLGLIAGSLIIFVGMIQLLRKIAVQS